MWLHGYANKGFNLKDSKKRFEAIDSSVVKVPLYCIISEGSDSVFKLVENWCASIIET